MGKPQRLSSCCGCYSLKVGTIIAGTLGILLSIATIVIILTTRIDFKTVVSWMDLKPLVVTCATSINSFVIDFWWLDFAICCKNHFDRQFVHDDHSLGAANRWSCNCEKYFCSNLVRSWLLSFQRNQYLFLPWIILGIMLCIGLLVDVIYTAVVFFLGDHNTAGILWLVIGLICVGELIENFFVASNSELNEFLFSHLFLLVGRCFVSLLAA